MKRLPEDDLRFVAETTAPWDELRGARLFVTGGTGFFGCWLLESFCAANRALGLGAHATVLTRNLGAFLAKAPHLAGDPAIELLAGDVRSFHSPQGEFTHIIHAAAASSAYPAPSDAEMRETIVHGTRRVLDFATECKARKLLLLSSGAVYGPQPPEIARVGESYKGAAALAGANAAYGEGKREAEAMCVARAGESALECKIARCFAFVGPHLPLDAHFAIGNFISNALRREPIRIKGDGTPLRSYLYMADTMVWLWTLLFRAPSMRAYNVGSESAVSIAELAQTVASVVAPELEVVVEMPATAAPVPRYIPSTKAAREELGLRETVDLREAIRRTAEWYM